MSAYSLAEVIEMLNFYKEAEKRVLKGKSMTHNGRSWTREDLPEIRKGRQEWERRYRSLSAPAGSRGPALAEF
ncbi:MAG: hypothetical protein ACPGF7_13680 [Pontibacterium sp.]